MIYALGFGDLAASIIVLFFWSNAVRIFFCSPLALFNQFAFENVCSFHELTLFQYLRLELIYGVALYATGNFFGRIWLIFQSLLAYVLHCRQQFVQP